MAAGPIPFTSIDRYAARYGITHIDEFERFRLIIRAMDGAYLGSASAGGDGGVRTDDVQGMRSLFSGLKSSMKAKLQAEGQAEPGAVQPKAPRCRKTRSTR